VGHVVRFGAMRNTYIILVKYHKGMRPLERLKHRLGGNIKIDLK
jgi:hypothetical protein